MRSELSLCPEGWRGRLAIRVDHKVSYRGPESGGRSAREEAGGLGTDGGGRWCPSERPLTENPGPRFPPFCSLRIGRNVLRRPGAGCYFWDAWLAVGWRALLGSGIVGVAGTSLLGERERCWWEGPSGSWSGPIGGRDQSPRPAVGGGYPRGGSRWSIHRHNGSVGRGGRVSVGKTTAERWRLHFVGCGPGLEEAGRKVADRC